MCMPSSSPDMVAAPAPPPIAKDPGTAPLLKKRNDLAAQSSGPDTVANKTLLTGAAGIPNTALTLGGSTLLGGGSKS